MKAYYVDAETGEPRTDNILKTVGGVVGVIAVLRCGFATITRGTR